VLKNVGGETSMNGIAPGCGLAAMYWLTTATGIGLGGSSDVANLISYAASWRGQKQTQNLDGLFHYQRLAQEKRTSPISGIGVGAAVVPLNDGANWPATMDSGAANDGRPASNAQQMFLPIIAPGRDLMTSKTQRVLGDLQIDFNSTVALTNPHEFMTWELMEFSEQQANSMAALGLFRGVARRKNVNGSPGKPGNFRYTAIEFE
jgi:hypothetical protein